MMHEVKVQGRELGTWMDDLNIYGEDTEYSGRNLYRAKPLSAARLLNFFFSLFFEFFEFFESHSMKEGRNYV